MRSAIIVESGTVIITSIKVFFSAEEEVRIVENVGIVVTADAEICL